MDPRVVSRRFGLLGKKMVAPSTEESRIRMLEDSRVIVENAEATAEADWHDDQQVAS